LRDANEQQIELMGVVAHDLRNPLSGIALSAELLLEEDDPEEIKRSIHRILGASKAMTDLISRYLNLRSLEAGRLKATPIDLDLVPVLQGIVLSFSGKASKKHQRLELKDLPESLVVVADERFTHEILENLLSNAVKYTFQGKGIEVRLIDSGEYARIEVADEGPGLTLEDKQKLFGKFAKLSAQPTGGEQSVGLGLSIVKLMIEALGGRIRVESEVDVGSTFIVELPKGVPESIIIPQ